MIWVEAIIFAILTTAVTGTAIFFFDREADL